MVEPNDYQSKRMENENDNCRLVLEGLKRPGTVQDQHLIQKLISPPALGSASAGICPWERESKNYGQ